MKFYRTVLPLLSVLFLSNFASAQDNSGIDYSKQFSHARALTDSQYLPEERHLKNIRQLTFDGENAEAYLSFDNKRLSLQARGTSGTSCDQIYTMNLNGTELQKISNGRGRTTCSYYLPSGDKVLYASTFESNEGMCPPEPDHSKGYVWALYPTFDIYVADTSGKVLANLTKGSDGYDAEATISPVGDKIVFTSTRTGDIELFTMNLDGSEVKQLTFEEGYDGGAFFSQDGKQIVYRASRPKDKELEEYRSLLKEHLIRPHSLELYVMNADGTNKRQVTNNGKANFAPFFFPDGKRIIFSSNMDDPKGRNFDIYKINTDGSGLERITYSGSFDGFPFFTSDGKQLIFCSNRYGSNPRNTNIFIADWVE